MSLALAVMILMIALIIAALAIYLIATIGELIKINRGLASVLDSVGEIVAKSAPVNGVVDAINGNLVAGRNLLENLFIKKAGSDTAGLVESLFPGEGAKWNQRVGKNYPVVNTGIVYTRGTQILASLRSRRPDRRGARARARQCATRSTPRRLRPCCTRGPVAILGHGRSRRSSAGTRRVSTRSPARLACGRVTATDPRHRRRLTCLRARRRRTRLRRMFRVRRRQRLRHRHHRPRRVVADDPGRLNVKGKRPWER